MGTFVRVAMATFINFKSLKLTESSNKQKTVFKHKKKAFLVALELLVVGLFLLALGSPYNKKLVNFFLFHPSKDMVIEPAKIAGYKTDYGAEVLQMKFVSKNGKKLHAWYIKVPDSETTYLVSHGNAGNLTYRYHVFDVLLASGGSVFIYDYQGYGLSEGDSDDLTIIDDGVSAYDFMVSNLKIPKDQIIGYGESLGCAVTTKIMEKRPLKAVILQSPFATLVGAAKDKIHWTRLYPDWMFSQNHLNNVDAYRKKHPPLLLIHGDTDWVLKSNYSRHIFKQAIEPKDIFIIPNLGHNNLYIQNDNKAVIEKIANFRKSVSKGI